MKLALISVYHKEGIDEIARKLKDKGWEIISTGGTAKFLKENGNDVLEVSDLTEFPEILDGRVKTLHPLVFGPILAKNNQTHLEQLRQLGTSKIDLVMVNFYPFENALLEKDKGIDYMIENIDIGGPSMVRAAAKNFKSTVVVVEKDDYLPVVDKLLQEGDIGLEEKQLLAQKAFSYCSFYDSLIANYLHKNKSNHPAYFSFSGRKKQDLRYGENPHQNASLYITDKNSPMCNFEKIQGKELSFNNILDLSMVYEVLNQFDDKDNFAVIVKHQNPCGAAVASSQETAFKNALAGDPKSAFGGIVGINSTLNKKTAELMQKIFFEVIVAPDFSSDALEVFKKKKNLRLVKLPLGYKETKDVKTIPGGFLVQERDNLSKNYHEFSLQTTRPVTIKEKKDVEFGWKLIKFVKSNGIILVKDRILTGVGAGQMSRVDAVEIALKKSQFPVEGSVLISDAFFPFPDSITIASEHKIPVVVEPGGSIRDKEVIEEAEKSKLSLLFTGMRHFRH